MLSLSGTYSVKCNQVCSEILPGKHKASKTISGHPSEGSNPISWPARQRIDDSNYGGHEVWPLTNNEPQHELVWVQDQDVLPNVTHPSVMQVPTALDSVF